MALRKRSKQHFIKITGTIKNGIRCIKSNKKVSCFRVLFLAYIFGLILSFRQGPRIVQYNVCTQSLIALQRKKYTYIKRGQKSFQVPLQLEISSMALCVSPLTFSPNMPLSTIQYMGIVYSHIQCIAASSSIDKRGQRHEIFTQFRSTF